MLSATCVRVVPHKRGSSNILAQTSRPPTYVREMSSTYQNKFNNTVENMLMFVFTYEVRRL
jgi:hypothetical protein